MFFYDSLQAYEKEDGMKSYSHEIINNEVYKKEDFTMICVDTQTDGNDFLSIFDNSKRINNPVIMNVFSDVKPGFEL